MALLDYLALFAQACRFSVPDEDLVHDAYPAGRDEADLQRIYRAARDCDWRLDPDPARRKPLPPALVEAVEDREYREAMRVRPVLACRKVVPDVFEAVLALITGPDSAVRTAAMTAAAYCLGHAVLGDRKTALAELLADTAAVSPEPRERTAVARLLGMLGYRPEALLRDEHPGVRACAALASGFADDERATRELVSALQAPQAADEWFVGWLPGREGWLHRDLATALAARAADLETVPPAALGSPRCRERSPTITTSRHLSNWRSPILLTEHSVLTPPQREFFSALLASPHLPFDRVLRRALLGT